jgi:hypothetical protein
LPRIAAALLKPRVTGLLVEFASVIEAVRCAVEIQRTNAIGDDLEFVKEQLARVPTRKELARVALLIIVYIAAFVFNQSASLVADREKFVSDACDPLLSAPLHRTEVTG